MANETVTQDETGARRNLAFNANHQISELAGLAKTICKDDDHQVFHGILSRIQTLAEIVYYTQRLSGASDAVEGAPNLGALNRMFEGSLP